MVQSNGVPQWQISLKHVHGLFKKAKDEDGGAVDQLGLTDMVQLMNQDNERNPKNKQTNALLARVLQFDQKAQQLEQMPSINTWGGSMGQSGVSESVPISPISMDGDSTTYSMADFKKAAAVSGSVRTLDDIDLNTMVQNHMQHTIQQQMQGLQANLMQSMGQSMGGMGMGGGMGMNGLGATPTTMG
jgi:hypothetical protein